eukprot:2607172-Lingulodinium_polyedra.AAC.1
MAVPLRKVQSGFSPRLEQRLLAEDLWDGPKLGQSQLVDQVTGLPPLHRRCILARVRELLGGLDSPDVEPPWAGWNDQPQRL